MEERKPTQPPTGVTLRPDCFFVSQANMGYGNEPAST
jgi:hypothetical protein